MVHRQFYVSLSPESNRVEVWDAQNQSLITVKDTDHDGIADLGYFYSQAVRLHKQIYQRHPSSEFLPSRLARFGEIRDSQKVLAEGNTRALRLIYDFKIALIYKNIPMIDFRPTNSIWFFKNRAGVLSQATIMAKDIYNSCGDWVGFQIEEVLIQSGSDHVSLSHPALLHSFHGALQPHYDKSPAGAKAVCRLDQALRS